MALIERCTSVEQTGWLALRQALWPDCSRSEHIAEMSSFLQNAARYVQFVAYVNNGEPCGFAEASVRTDYVNGTQASPVAFLEGIYVAPQYRRQGIAKELVAAVAHWAHSAGYRELASDALLGNALSHTVHQALGFVETERVVFYRRAIS